MVFQDGCVTTFIEKKNSNENMLAITSRVIRPSGEAFKINDNNEHITNSLLFLFNEYRIMIEGVLLKHSIPYKVLKLEFRNSYQITKN